MGFGLLFVGFMMMLDQSWAISVSPAVGFDLLPDVVGYLCMFFSMKHLRKSSKDLNVFAYIAAFMSVLSGIFLLSQVTAIVMRFAVLPGLSVISVVETVYYAVKYPIMIVAILFMSSGLREIADSVGLEKLSKRTAIFTSVSSVCYLGISMKSFLPTNEIWAYFASLGVSLLFYVQYFMMLVMIFSYYRQIGFEGEDDLPEKDPLLVRFLQKAVRARAKYDEDDD